MSFDYKKIISLMPGHVYWKDRNGFFQGCNKLQVKDAGFDNEDDIIGKNDYEMPWKAQADYLKNIDKNIMDSGEPRALEELFELPDGTKRLYWTKKIPLFDDAGDVSGILGISVDITKNKELEEKLKIASQAKSEFIANMSHDLRTPMSGLLGMLDGLLYAEEDARLALKPGPHVTKEKLEHVLNDTLGKIKEYAGMARNSADKLNQLHNDILDNIELESGESTEVDTPFNLDQLTQTIVGLQKPVAVNKGLELTAEIEPGTPCYLKV